jgi:hypothetical protein
MALDFPANPVDGQRYPDPPIPGVQQYVYNGIKGTWLSIFPGVQEVSAVSPLFVTGTDVLPVINIPPASPTEDGFMSAYDKEKLDQYDPATAGTVRRVTAGMGIGAPNTGDSITEEGTLNLIPPTSSALGGVKAGPGIRILGDGQVTLAPGSTFTVLDNLSSQFNGSRISFQITVNGTAYSPVSSNYLLIFVGGIIQVPGQSFSVNGSALTFSAAPPTGSSFYGISLT